MLAVAVAVAGGLALKSAGEHAVRHAQLCHRQAAAVVVGRRGGRRRCCRRRCRCRLGAARGVRLQLGCVRFRKLAAQRPPRAVATRGAPAQHVPPPLAPQHRLPARVARRRLPLAAVRQVLLHRACRHQRAAAGGGVGARPRPVRALGRVRAHVAPRRLAPTVRARHPLRVAVRLQVARHAAARHRRGAAGVGVGAGHRQAVELRLHPGVVAQLGVAQRAAAVGAGARLHVALLRLKPLVQALLSWCARGRGR
jgi:hypothetical protein